MSSAILNKRARKICCENQNLVHDITQNFAVCTNCGIVDRDLVATQQTFDQSQQTTATSAFQTLGTGFSSTKFKLVNQKAALLAGCKDTLHKLERILDEMCDRFNNTYHISKRLRDRAKIVMRDMFNVKRSDLKRINMKAAVASMKKHELYAAVAICLTFREAGSGVSYRFAQVAEVCNNVKTKDIISRFKQFERILYKTKHKSDRAFIEVRSANVTDMVPSVRSRLGLPFECERVLRKTLGFLDRQPALDTFMPSTKLAAIVYLFIQKSDEYELKTDPLAAVSQVCGVSVCTVKSSSLMILEYLRQKPCSNTLKSLGY